jgi:hypothetical protein
MMMAASHAEEPKQHAFHDIYKELYENGRYRNEGGVGLQCCGGDPYDGDCEPVGSNYAILPNGDAVFASRRYSANVLVARDKIMWMSIRGGEFSEAHWCGRLRVELVSPERGIDPPTELNPDPRFYTYCATIAPHGY